MATSFVNTKKALVDFKNVIACAACEKSVKDLQFLGTSCKHAFCWDCISSFTDLTKKKRGYSAACPRCAMQLNMSKISGATILNNCFDMLEELAIHLNEFEEATLSKEDFCSTQMIFADFNLKENVRTVEDFLLTQPPFNEDDDENDNDDKSPSPELDYFGNFVKSNEIKKEEIEIKQEPSSTGLKRPLSKFEDDSPRRPSKKSKNSINFPEQMLLFGSQLPERTHDNNSLSPFVNRRSTAPAASSGMVAMFADPIRSVKVKKEPSPDDPFVRNVAQPRKTMSTKADDVKRETKSRTRASLQRERQSISRSASPASLEIKSNTKSPRRSSFGTRRGEVVIINSIMNNRIPQLQSAIDAGTCLNEKEGDKTPLYVAVEHNNLKAVELLVNNGALINASCLPSCETTLHEAVRQKNHKIAEFLLSKGASMKIRNSWKKTAENLIDENDVEMKRIFHKHRNKHVLQPVVNPRRPRIYFVQLIDEKSLTEREKTRLPGKLNLVNSEISGVTHVVIDVEPKSHILTISKENLAQILTAIIRPSLLVSTKWLKDCISDERKVENDKDYIIKKVRVMDGPVIEGSKEKWKKTDDRMSPKLFVGCKFHFLRTKYQFLDRPALIEIVRAGGGLAFPREPVLSEHDPPPYHNPNLAPNFIVYSLNHDVPNKYRDSSKFTLVCEAWLIEAILNFSLTATPY
ncbi:unnamed protein product [Caenorhabditis bovis]|uniref:RING-type domain-containing protein n=1 Tax=Caenorhabditis bovis TaxID=2654633 RepID=A0A8S1EI84_9PELO|nr:unnamed protein product [Caenorhabditis bovis]